jgi:hypothetical protein
MDHAEKILGYFDRNGRGEGSRGAGKKDKNQTQAWNF